MILMQRSAACHTQHINKTGEKAETGKNMRTHPQAICVYGRFEKPHVKIAMKLWVGQLVGWLLRWLVDLVDC